MTEVGDFQVKGSVYVALAFRLPKLQEDSRLRSGRTLDYEPEELCSRKAVA